MRHTLTQLKILVGNHNADALAMLASSRPALFSGRPTLQNQPIHEASVLSNLPNCSLGSWEGVLSQQAVPIYDLVRSALCPDQTGQIAAVFSVVEDTGLMGTDFSSELPVALCVGINYTQWTSFKGMQPLVGNTYMYQKVNQAILDATGGSPSPFHLIVANFFPWVTVDNWRYATGKRTNHLHDMLLLETCGFCDPVGHVKSLAEDLQPKWLIFHGVDNCVSSLGNTVRKALRHEVIFCDNISPQYMGKNAVRF